jgi:hypothetical protein
MSDKRELKVNAVQIAEQQSCEVTLTEKPYFVE